MDKNGRRSGKMMKSIPAFGDWDAAGHLPITHYFDSAAAGAPSSGDLYRRTTTVWGEEGKGGRGKKPVRVKVCDLPTASITMKGSRNDVVGGYQPPRVQSARNCLQDPAGHAPTHSKEEETWLYIKLSDHALHSLNKCWESSFES